MNRIDFNQVGGFPMTTNILGKMQTAYSLFNAFGNIVGDKTIISGCDVTGSNTSNGVVFINGEVFEFRGGLTQSKVLIKEESESLLFQNNNAYPVVKNRYVQFGTGVGAIDWVDFKRGFPTKNIDTLIQRIEDLEARPTVGNIPIGLIAIWGQAADLIPDGWEEYTPLAGRVPVGFNSADPDFDAVLSYGGSKDAVLVEHDHEITNSGNVNNGQTGGNLGNKTARWDSGSGTLLNGDVSTEGESGAGKNMQPYRVVHFIKYVG